MDCEICQTKTCRSCGGSGLKDDATLCAACGGTGGHTRSHHPDWAPEPEQPAPTFEQAEAASKVGA